MSEDDKPQSESGTRRFESIEGARDQLLDVMARARDTLWIMTPNLWPALFDEVEVVTAIKDLALRHQRVQINIQVAEVRHWQSDGHRWLPLIQRLPSRFDVRQYQRDYWERNGYSEHRVFADRQLAWCAQSEAPPAGFSHLDDAGLVRVWQGEFTQHHKFTQEPSRLRRLT
ncbi:MAG: hypothetical protein LAT62_02105 [Natronospirillum sp.]|uniref:DUF7931 domain-containing protein n=1 Tax=Natronospirillum sp. TaxID=2812955 RepID=UPI0025CD717C|nr:hypothetical protein [Natronospirillum sp.]MCH8550699.1 hypothetical protein [Natronospirillum sp.]